MLSASGDPESEEGGGEARLERANRQRSSMGGDLPATREAKDLSPLPAELVLAGRRNDPGVETREGDFGGPWRHC
jgi:hypothetical protein